MFQKATRKKAKLRLALIGPSGSGKTFSALELASGLGGKIALIDTERGSGDLYADRFVYDTLQLEPPFTPQKYIQAIKAAEDEGYSVVIIDSLSHAWAGEGGILDIHDNASKASRSGNGYMAWKDVTPQHERIINAILGASVHVIGTIRTKTAYEVVEDERGKKAPKRIGLAPIQRQGMEYEFTCVLDLAVDSHVASASKDRTGMFDGQHFVITERTGEQLLEWLEAGDEPAPKVDQFAEWRAQIKTAPSLEKLIEVWGQMDRDTREALEQDKNDRKDELFREAA
ncbi:AAA family ATPase [Dyella halodurans]|uniref:ATP-binding protein n=1 Tax=Dyella halodurans TaxID=1920171 RepID=A0ABV9C091_9GAMM|nr:ATP-binding protein [Dyella halodurans]